MTYPRRGAIDFQRATVEYLLETGAHFDCGRRGQSVGGVDQRFFSSCVVVTGIRRSPFENGGENAG